MYTALLLLSRISKPVVSVREWSITVHLCGVILLFLLQTIPYPGRPLGEGPAGAHLAPGRCVCVPAACSSTGNVVRFTFLSISLKTFYSVIS